MASTNNIQWKRVFVEAVTIVVSILMAFSIQAWWDERQDREDERIILLSLQEELTGIDELIPWLDQYAGAIRESAKELLTAALGRDQELGAREFDRLLGDLTWFHMVADFDVPELDSLVLSNDLLLIESKELRSKLKMWKWSSDFLKQRMVHQQEFFDERFMPFLEENTSMQQIYQVATRRPGKPSTLEDEGWPQHKIELKALRSHLHLLEDPVFQNLLTQRIEEQTVLLDARPEYYQSGLDELITLIEQELTD